MNPTVTVIPGFTQFHRITDEYGEPTHFPSHERQFQALFEDARRKCFPGSHGWLWDLGGYLHRREAKVLTAAPPVRGIGDKAVYNPGLGTPQRVLR